MLFLIKIIFQFKNNTDSLTSQDLYKLPFKTSAFIHAGVCLTNIYCGPTECWARDKMVNKTYKIFVLMAFMFPLARQKQYWFMYTVYNDTELHMVVRG